MGRYDGRVAVVTGSARGIGAGTAKRFADEGAAVAVLDLDEDQASATANGLGASKAVGIGCNVGDAASVEAAVELANALSRVLDQGTAERSAQFAALLQRATRLFSSTIPLLPSSV